MNTIYIFVSFDYDNLYIYCVRHLSNSAFSLGRTTSFSSLTVCASGPCKPLSMLANLPGRTSTSFDCWFIAQSEVSAHEHHNQTLNTNARKLKLRTQTLTSPSSHHFPKIPYNPSPTSPLFGWNGLPHTNFVLAHCPVNSYTNDLTRQRQCTRLARERRTQLR